MGQWLRGCFERFRFFVVVRINSGTVQICDSQEAPDLSQQSSSHRSPWGSHWCSSSVYQPAALWWTLHSLSNHSRCLSTQRLQDRSPTIFNILLNCSPEGLEEQRAVVEEGGREGGREREGRREWVCFLSQNWEINHLKQASACMENLQSMGDVRPTQKGKEFLHFNKNV